jgi:hypothetical protein
MERCESKRRRCGTERYIRRHLSFTESDGTVHTKAEVVAALKSGENWFLASKASEMKVSLRGRGVVTGRWAGKFIVKGKTVDTVERFTDTYVRQNGQWRCVATQGTTAK